MDFKDVSDNHRVPLITMRFRGRAQAWWQQTKQNRTRMGKAKINSWEKCKKYMWYAFLPYNYERELSELYECFQLNFMSCLRMSKTIEFLNSSAACASNSVMFLVCLTM